MIANKLIENYIQEYAIPSTIAKGEKIARSTRSFSAVDIDLKNAIATLRVKGTQVYRVTITNFSKDIDSSCTCPYNWGGICKHQVAALIYLDDFLQKPPIDTEPAKKKPAEKTAQPESSLRMSSQPYLIQPYIPLTPQVIINHTVRTKSFYHSKINEVMKVMFQGQAVVANVKERNNYWSYNNNTYEVSFTKSGESLAAVCTCTQLVEKLCEHEAAALETIMQTLGNYFFEILNPGYIERRVADWAETTGLPVEIILDYYDFDIRSQSFKPKKKAVGLVGFHDGAAQKKQEKFLEKFQRSTESSLPFDSGNLAKSEALGYVFSFDDPLVVNLVPFTGVPDNSGLMKYIKDYSPQNIPLYMDEKDELILAICAELEYFTESLTDGYYKPNGENLIRLQQFNHKKLYRLFELLKDREYLFYRFPGHSGNIKKYQLNPVNLSNVVPSLFFEMEEQPVFFSLKAKVRLEDQIIDLSDPELKLPVIFPHQLLVCFNDTLYIQPSIHQAETIEELVRKNTTELKCVKRDVDLFFEKFVFPISKSYPVEYKNMESLKTQTTKLRPKERQLYISELGSFIIFTPVVLYNDGTSVKIREQTSIVKKSGDLLTVYERDEDFEAEFLEVLRNLHPDFSGQMFSEFFFIPFTALTKNNWFFDVFEKLTDENITVFGVNELKSIKYSPYKASIKSHIKSGQDWFDVSIEIAFGDEMVKLSDVRKAVMRNERFVKLSDGKMGLLPEEWFEKFKKYFRIGQVEKGELKISKLKFSVIDELFDQINDKKLMEELAHKKKKMREFQSIKKVQLPKEVQADLRHYQVEGYNWLNFLDEFRWGGILADDMGLGKTLQVLSFLQKITKTKKQPNLVVVPTTLLFNWENEIGKFTPNLKYIIHHGPERTTDAKALRSTQLVITTYGLAANDVELLKKIKFNYIILDESQAIKNPASKRYKAVCLLNGANKIAMTGTPIENNTFDLYAQLNFLNPGFLGSQQSFKDNFSKPIDVERDAERAAELQKLVKPFVLRRTKEQVAKELPSKVEDYIYCEMGDDQRRVYDAYRNKYRDFLLDKIEEEGLEKSKIFIIEGLLKLRQICNSPALLNDEEDYGRESVKIKELIRHILEKTGKHKILVFSQFVKMLKLIETELKKNKIKYEYLDGQSTTEQRKKSVEVFQNDENYRVFLISLKAGGTGLNLTAADYVYLVDPWWNPAVENQAIDRTHRIGQDKHIIAYRMICRNTIEEKIINLQQKKLKIASDIINTDEGVLKSLSKEDVNALFL